MIATRGFTLIETLVAVLVFALLATAAYSALNSLTQAATAQRAHAQQLDALQHTLTRFETDLRSAVWRPVRTPDGQWEPALWGSAEQVSFTRSGWLNPLDQPRAELQRLRWSWDAQTLSRGSWPVLDRTAGTPYQSDWRLDEVLAFELRYRTDTGQWVSQWPIEPAVITEAPLPTAVELWITVEPWGRLRRLVVL